MSAGLAMLVVYVKRVNTKTAGEYEVDVVCETLCLGVGGLNGEDGSGLCSYAWKTNR